MLARRSSTIFATICGPSRFEDDLYGGAIYAPNGVGRDLAHDGWLLTAPCNHDVRLTAQYQPGRFPGASEGAHHRRRAERRTLRVVALGGTLLTNRQPES